MITVCTKKRSSWIHGVDYWNGILTLDLADRMYVYDSVPAWKVMGLLGAESLGQYFNEYVKGQHEYRELV